MKKRMICSGKFAMLKKGLLSAVALAAVLPQLGGKCLADTVTYSYITGTYCYTETDYGFTLCPTTDIYSGVYEEDYCCNCYNDSCDSWTVRVDSGYLALRNAMAYDRSNEIGELYTGDTVRVEDASDSTYWYVYSPSLGKYGYVNKNYLVSPNSAPVSAASWTVRVDSGYLALRNAMAYDRSNEIGELYTGDTVQVQDASDSTYWYVYSPKLKKYGYVNCEYLY